jgi:xylan 1,4-beta-xylosidase
VTGKTGSPIDYIGFHAKGSPKVVDGHVQMGISNQLRSVSRGFEIVASFPELKRLPIIIGESDPEGCAACSVRFHPQNGYRNGTMYSSYTAASFARKHDLAARHQVNFEGAVTWAFEFEDQPYFAGFRQLASCGLPLPVFNVIRMFSLMNGKRITAESDTAVSLDNIMRRGDVALDTLARAVIAAGAHALIVHARRWLASPPIGYANSASSFVGLRGRQSPAQSLPKRADLQAMR